MPGTLKNICALCHENLTEPINETGFYEFRCSNGHLNQKIFLPHPFELHFNNACYSILSSNYRDAIVSFASSLDCFYKLFVEIYFYQEEKERSVIRDLFKSIYLSERRFGAFMATHVIAFGDLPKKLNSSSVSLRNDVVHNGKFPNLKEAEKFGQECLEIILPTTLRMKSYLRNGVTKERNYFLEDAKSFATSPSCTAMSLVSIIPYSMNRLHMLDANLNELIDHYKVHFNLYG